MRVMIAGGGSGGHLFPGVAVAEEFKERDTDTEVIFMGTEHGIESKVIPREGYQIIFIEAEGVLGRSILGKLAASIKILRSVFSCRKLFSSLGPDVVIGTGGYVSVGPVAAASTMSIPTMVLEQNLMPGFANRLLGRFANLISVTYHESMAYFPRAKTRLTGNPVRRAMMKGERSSALGLFELSTEKETVLVLGGSAGASRINNAVIGALNSMLDLRDRVQFLHQTGERDYENVRKMYRQMGFGAMVVPFIHQMAEAYAAADLVVSRAGATTLAEITVLGKPSVLVPYPHAAGHQDLNARKLLDVGACRLIEDRELTAEGLAQCIRELMESEETRSEMRSHCRSLGRPDAAQRVVDLALSLARARKPGV